MNKVTPTSKLGDFTGENNCASDWIFLLQVFFVKVKPNAREEKIEVIDATHLKAAVKAAPEKGRANEALIEILAEYLKVKKRNITIIKGLKSRCKTLNIGNI